MVYFNPEDKANLAYHEKLVGEGWTDEDVRKVYPDLYDLARKWKVSRAGRKKLGLQGGGGRPWKLGLQGEESPRPPLPTRNRTRWTAQQEAAYGKPPLGVHPASRRAYQEAAFGKRTDTPSPYGVAAEERARRRKAVARREKSALQAEREGRLRSERIRKGAAAYEREPVTERARQERAKRWALEDMPMEAGERARRAEEGPVDLPPLDYRVPGGGLIHEERQEAEERRRAEDRMMRERAEFWGVGPPVEVPLEGEAESEPAGLPLEDMMEWVRLTDPEFHRFLRKYDVSNPFDPRHHYDYRKAYEAGVEPTRWRDLPFQDRLEDMLQVLQGKRPPMPPDAWMWPDLGKTQGHPVPPKKGQGNIRSGMETVTPSATMSVRG